MIYVGIDPGKVGGYAWIWDGMATTRPWDDTFFIQDMQCLLATHDGVMAAVEKVGARPGQGTVSMFHFGESVGFINGVLRALGMPFQTVPPNVWKRDYSLIGKDKKSSIEVCRRLFPDVDLKRTEKCRTDSDGKADSLLLAEYARRHFGEGYVE